MYDGKTFECGFPGSKSTIRAVWCDCCSPFAFTFSEIRAYRRNKGFEWFCHPVNRYQITLQANKSVCCGRLKKTRYQKSVSSIFQHASHQTHEPRTKLDQLRPLCTDSRQHDPIQNTWNSFASLQSEYHLSSRWPEYTNITTTKKMLVHIVYHNMSKWKRNELQMFVQFVSNFSKLLHEGFKSDYVVTLFFFHELVIFSPKKQNKIFRWNTVIQHL